MHLLSISPFDLTYSRVMPGGKYLSNIFLSFIFKSNSIGTVLYSCRNDQYISDDDTSPAPAAVMAQKVLTTLLRSTMAQSLRALLDSWFDKLTTNGLVDHR